MEELQARIKAIRALQTEMNLAMQPDSEPFDPDNTEFRSEAKVVEMPERNFDGTAEEMPPKRSRRKSQGATSKRKSQPSAEKPKALVPFRQLRESQQPIADDLKRLEAQAERINQLLAERTSKQSQLSAPEQPDEEIEDASRTGQTKPAKSTASARKKSTKGSRQTQPSLDDSEALQMSAQEDEDTQNLKIQAERINRLLAELEDTIRQAGAIANDSERVTNPSSRVAKPSHSIGGSVRNQRSSDRQSVREPDFYEAYEQPSQRNLKKAVQEAAETAQALRYLANQERDYPSSPNLQMNVDLPENYMRWSPSSSRSPVKRFGIQLRDLFRVPQKPMDRLGDAVLWIVVAAVVRVGSRFLIATYPAYSFLFIALMLAPAILAVYLAVFVPKAGFVSVYRLFLIMLGLLLGGKL